MAGFDIEDVGGSIKETFSGKRGKVILIGGGILIVGAFLMMKKKPSDSGQVSFSEYPIAPAQDIPVGQVGSTTTDQLAALSDTFTDSLTNMNTNFTEMLNAQQNSFQGQIDSINMSMSENFVALNDNVADTMGSVTKSAADVSMSLTDFANSRATSLAAVEANADGYGFGGADYSTTSKGVREKMVSDMQKIQSGDKAFIENDLARTAQVIEQRKKAGLDISDQLKHQKTLELAK